MDYRKWRTYLAKPPGGAPHVSVRASLIKLLRFIKELAFFLRRQAFYLSLPFSS
jgi:hypothetical protein